MELKNKTIILGVSGCIAVHKSLDVASQLVKQGASVHVVMTSNATRMVQPIQFQVISRNPVLLNLYDSKDDWQPPHISLADLADLLVVAPATANIVGKIANGIADDALSTVAISVHCPVLLAPAMNSYMYQNAFVEKNLQKLRKNGINLIEPASGLLACGHEGIGRLEEVDVILERIASVLVTKKDLVGKKVIVTAGPTREHIDPIRFITNRSSGRMGYAIAEMATARGAEVTLISGKTHLEIPAHLEFRQVETAAEMRKAILDDFDSKDVVIMSAAVSDYRPSEYSSVKIKKTEEPMTISLSRNVDILSDLSDRKDPDQLLVGFAAETDNILQNAQQKLVTKNLDLIIANDVSAEGAGFEVDTNIVSIIDGEGKCDQLPLMPKSDIADQILDRIVQLFQK
ncbi:MAG: bifunctional phosphopantothenoylcysteine decarboxylase/phosphopantothenate--cysteine ligase CoaBC [Candidatus Poribacteria bacterium]|nr:bifunctional phosphopantothenoylcysteine decarboxylase/phosphopantothenate--cysteine ligase CoaBC [Candidatus Poribacteria bacterium]